MPQAVVKGVGHYTPEKVVTNFDLEKLMNTTDSWIRDRTGIKERRFFNPETDTVANMAAKASRKALDKANLKPSDVDFIVFATITPDYYFPGSGVLLQRELDLYSIGALDIRNACSGFIYALSVADQFIKSGMYKTILVVGAEIQSSAMDISDEGRNVSVIFGDGAGAVVLQASEDKDKGILSTHLHSDGRFAEELYIKDPGSSRKERLSEEYIRKGGHGCHMNGNLVFKHAVTKFPKVIMEALEKNNLKKEDIDLLIPHQANFRITQHVQQVFGLSDDKVVSNIHKYGNTTAASIPIALSEAWEEGRIKEGDLLCMASFGSGFTWASALIRV